MAGAQGAAGSERSSSRLRGELGALLQENLGDVRHFLSTANCNGAGPKRLHRLACAGPAQEVPGPSGAF